MIVAITGHRPEKLPDQDYVLCELKRSFQELGVTKVIQGMAAGVDLIAARAAYELEIPFICARPWKTYRPRKDWENRYNSAIKHAEEVVNVSLLDYYPGPFIYNKRNEWMVDHAEYLIAVWDGSPGGTSNCVNYALSKSMRMHILSPAKSNGGQLFNPEIDMG